MEVIVIDDQPGGSLEDPILLVQQQAPELMTPEEIADALLSRTELETVRAVPLLCGVVLPPLAIKIDSGIPSMGLLLGDETTGQVVVVLDVEHCTPDSDDSEQDQGAKLVDGDLRKFFHSFQLTPAYRTAIAAVTPLPPAHLFMMLVDEIICRALLRAPNPDFMMSLEDQAQVGGRPTPFALRGRKVFDVQRTSRFLQFVRGIGYYEPFGYWPHNQTAEQYLQAVRGFARPGQIGITQASAGFRQALASRKTSTSLLKQYPPVLPPLSPDDPLRRFGDIRAFMERVLRVGSYGRMVAPPFDGAPGEGLETVATEFDRPFPEFTEFNKVMDLGAWTVDVREVFSAMIRGPVGPRFGELLAYAEAAGQRAWPGEPIELQWAVAEWKTERPMMVGGKTFRHRSPFGFVAPGADLLVEAGFVPSALRHTPELVGRLLQEARECQDLVGQRFVGEHDPHFARCLPVARALAGDLWVRPTLKRARQE
jgi:hypothetical protein